MAGQLIQVNTATVTVATPSVTLTGIDSDDVYMVAVNNSTSSVDVCNYNIRFTTSGTPDTTSNYDFARFGLDASATFEKTGIQNSAQPTLGNGGTGTSEQMNWIIYLFNFNNASEYSFMTFESTGLERTPKLKAFQGGMVHTVAQACDGIQFFYSSGNITGGTFTLYKVV